MSEISLRADLMCLGLACLCLAPTQISSPFVNVDVCTLSSGAGVSEDLSSPLKDFSV